MEGEGLLMILESLVFTAIVTLDNDGLLCVSSVLLFVISQIRALVVEEMPRPCQRTSPVLCSCLD